MLVEVQCGSTRQTINVWLWERAEPWESEEEMTLVAKVKITVWTLKYGSTAYYYRRTDTVDTSLFEKVRISTGHGYCRVLLSDVSGQQPCSIAGVSSACSW